MSHHIYQTEGFVLESSDSGEANRLITVFTRELGLLRASAQSVRSEKSKLRYSLQDLSFADLALVKGKEMWRLTSANKRISLYDPRLSIVTRRLLARVLAFVSRLVSGEGRNPELYGILSGLSAFCFGASRADIAEYHEEMEILAKLRILAALGYASSKEELLPFIYSIRTNEEMTAKDWNPGLFEEVRKVKKICLAETDRALRESHL